MTKAKYPKIPGKTKFGNPSLETKWGRAHLAKGRWHIRSLGDLHILVWEETHGPRPDNHDIHHLDENPLNNEISNLVCVSKSDHRRIHAGWVKTGEHWTHKPCHKCSTLKKLSEFSISKSTERGERLRGSCKDCVRKYEENRNKKRLTPEYYKNHKKKRLQRRLKLGLLCRPSALSRNGLL